MICYHTQTKELYSGIQHQVSGRTFAQQAAIFQRNGWRRRKVTLRRYSTMLRTTTTKSAKKCAGVEPM